MLLGEKKTKQMRLKKPQATDKAEEEAEEEPLIRC